MSTPLLATKLYIPTPRPTLVQRQRLIDKLNQGLDQKFILISAPAGFGKTTLLSTWVNQGAVPTAWLSLDQSDNDQARYLAYIIKALQTINPGLGEEIFETLQSPQADTSQSTLIDLINEIIASISNDFVLVLDDYHLLSSQAVFKITDFLLEHIPPVMHLVIATRADPDLSLPRLRGRGELVEIRQTDLRFTQEEAADFLKKAHHLRVTTVEIETLALRTEGWIAGLQMAAISMSGKQDISRYVQDLAGTDRYILDYLVEEVLEQQPEEIQKFLLQTSIITKLTAPLCTALTGAQNAQEILEQFERGNLFIMPLDNAREWYRYHQLFADLLQNRLDQKQPENIPELHRQASLWYEVNGFVTDAIRHSLAARDYERAVNLVDEAAEDTLMRSELSTLLEWIKALPDEILRQRPVLCHYYAYIMLMYGYPLKIIETYIGDSKATPEQIAGHVAALRAFMAIIQRDVPRAVKFANQAINSLPESDRFFRIMTIWVKSASSMVAGDLEGGHLALDEVARQSQAVGNTMVSAIVLCFQAQLQILKGELYKAQKLFERACDLAKDRDGSYLPIAGEALFGLGDLFYEWGRLEDALIYLEEGLALTQKWGSVASVDGLLTKAKVFRAQGELDAAQEILLEAQHLAIQSEASALDDYLVDAHLAHNWLEQGNISAALRWVYDRGLAESSEDSGKLLIDQSLAELDQVIAGSFLSGHQRRSIEFFSLVRVLLEQGQAEDALAILERLLEISQSRKLYGREIQIKILTALVHQTRGGVHQALDSIKRALSLAEKEGYMRIFLDEGKPMRDLLNLAASEEIAPSYVNKLLDGFNADLPSLAHALIDPLSAREMDVLRLLPSKLTASEIADQLYVAESTVRTHIKHIYTKLNVNRRFEAVEQAKELGLL